MPTREEQPEQTQPSITERTQLQCLIADFTAVPRSNWHLQIIDARIVFIDRTRPFVTRGALLLALTGCVLWVGMPTQWWLLLLLPAAVQISAEIFLEPIVRTPREAVASTSASGHRRWYWRVLHLWYWNYDKSITNATGLLGLFACVAQLALVLFVLGPTPEEVAWVKVAALALAVLYTSSASLGPMMDASIYSTGAGLPERGARAVRLGWVLVLTVLAGCVAADAEAWGSTWPYAFMAVGLGYYPALRQREFDRTVAAAWHVRQEADSAAQVAMARDLHDLTQPVKGTLQDAARLIPTTMARIELEDYIANMEYIYDEARLGRADPRRGLLPPVELLLRREARKGLVRLKTDIQLPRDVEDTNYRRATSLLRTMVANTVQAYAATEGGRGWVLAKAHATATHVTVEVHDGLPLIPAHVIDTSLTLGGIRKALEQVGGSLTQHRLAQGKFIRATWPSHVHPRQRDTELEATDA